MGAWFGEVQVALPATSFAARCIVYCACFVLSIAPSDCDTLANINPQTSGARSHRSNHGLYRRDSGAPCAVRARAALPLRHGRLARVSADEALERRHLASLQTARGERTPRGRRVLIK